MSASPAAPGVEEEQEVDLSSAWQRLKLRWWLPIGGLVLGAAVGIALALASGSVWRAQTIVYLGQPFAPLGGGQIQSLATNPRTVGEIIRTAEGKPARVGCRQSGRSCGMIDRCRTQGMWDALEARIEEFLDSMSVQDLFEERRETREEVGV